MRRNILKEFRHAARGHYSTIAIRWDDGTPRASRRAYGTHINILRYPVSLRLVLEVRSTKK